MAPPIKKVPRHSGKRDFAGSAYIIIPKNEERKKYIKQCLNLGAVSMITEGGEVLHNIKIGKLALQLIEFPENTNEKGSLVMWVNHMKHNMPVIVDVLTKGDEAVNSSENELSLEKTTENASASVSVKGEGGRIILSVDSDDEDGGEIHLVVNNASKKGLLKMSVQGAVEIDAVEDVVIKSNQIARINAKEKVLLGKGEEPMLLGKVWEEVYNAFIDEVAAITTTTAMGVMPILNKVQVTTLKKRTESVLSKYGFLQ